MGDGGRPAGGGEGAGDAEEDDLLSGGEGVDGDLLQLVVLVEPAKLAVGEAVADADRSHGSPLRVRMGGDEELLGRKQEASGGSAAGEDGGEWL